MDRTYFVYMLRCADATYYTGHTDYTGHTENLDRRVASRAAGEISGYPAARLPVALVWSETFPTRLEALEAERQIKGWTRAKKEALIRGDWPLISELARSKNTSVRPEPVEGRSGSASHFDTDSLSPLEHTQSNTSVRPEPVEGPSENTPHPDTSSPTTQERTQSNTSVRPEPVEGPSGDAPHPDTSSPTTQERTQSQNSVRPEPVEGRSGSRGGQGSTP